MEVLLFALFFLIALIFFIAGKDDFGRKEIKTKEELKQETENVSAEEPKEELKQETENVSAEEPKE